MKYICLLSALGFAANGLPSYAAEKAPTVESLLAKWEEASQKCRSMDAKLKVFRYDRALGDDQPTIEHGRFYYEAPNLARYQVGKYREGSVNDWSGVSEALIWKGKEALRIDGRTWTVLRFSARDVETFAGKTGGLFSEFIKGLFWVLERPQHCLPLVFDIHAADVRERFDVMIEQSSNEKEIELRATPKRPLEKTVYAEIRVILNADTYMTRAIQVSPPGAIGRTVFVLHDQKVNQRPSDRDQLINPDLSGLRVMDCQ